jgi:hypothetical protein
MSAEGWAIIIGAVFVGVAKIVSMVLDYRREQAKILRDAVIAEKVAGVAMQAQVAARKAEEVKKTLVETTAANDQQLSEIAKTGKDTHMLVNSAMGAQKRLLAVTSRAKATITNEAMDMAAADAAEADLREHEAKQNRLDSQDRAAEEKR